MHPLQIGPPLLEVAMGEPNARWSYLGGRSGSVLPPGRWPTTHRHGESLRGCVGEIFKCARSRADQ